jgi:hypothetical protein
MARTWLVLVVALAPGCTISWGGPAEHRPAIAQELDSLRKPSPSPSTWSPDPTVVERAMLGPSLGGAAPTDDSPTWLGPSHTALATATGDRPGVSSEKELDVRRQEYEDHVAGRVDEERRSPEPRPWEVDRALSLWEE